MDSRPPLSGQAPLEDVTSDRLDGWKSISAFLNRDVRTAQRWERTEHLPIHRPANSKRGSVFAFKSEIDEWWKNRHPILRHIETQIGTSDQHSGDRGASPTYLRTLVYAGLILVGLLVMGAGTLLFRPRVEPAKTQVGNRINVAVLPFENLSQDASDRTLAVDITHEVIIALEKTNEFRVIPMFVPDQTRSDASPQEQYAREYHLEALVEGSVTRSGDTIQVAMQLIDASTGRRISSDQFVRSSQAKLAFEGEVGRLISVSVRTSLLPSATFP
ncbi:MAG TPA: hypothetical protein VGR72_02355 [Candidatus Acidoferrales bacterium]|nr:hypothetical protein [Candidatus Acidoferrales bacterium]